MSSGPRGDGLIVHSEMPIAVVRSKPIRSFDRLRANGCDSQAGCGNRTVSALHQEEIDALCHYMDVERGLSPATIATARHRLEKFFKHIRTRQLSNLSIADVERFLALLTRFGVYGVLRASVGRASISGSPGCSDFLWDRVLRLGGHINELPT
jgi:hypothetical protein